MPQVLAAPLAPGIRRPEPGRVEIELLSAVARAAAPARGVALAVISVFGVLATPDDALPLSAGLLALALVGGAADVFSGLTGRGTRLAIWLAVARAAAICGTQQWTAPEPGEPNLWALNTLTITVITLQWERPPLVTVPLAAALLTVQVLPLDFGDGLAAVMRVSLEGLLARVAFTFVHRATRRIDDLRERQARLAREESLALARTRREREYLALLHDTASATFLMVAQRGDDPDEVAGYARRDLAILSGSTENLVDLESSLRAIVEESPLTVSVRWVPVPLIPPAVALALTRAVREALLNVHRHAGVGTAELTVEAGHGIVVCVRDQGRGFDPDAVTEHHRGIRGSLRERLTAVGGSATVTSSPGAGTRVELRWSDA